MGLRLRGEERKVMLDLAVDEGWGVVALRWRFDRECDAEA